LLLDRKLTERKTILDTKKVKRALHCARSRQKLPNMEPPHTPPDRRKQRVPREGQEIFMGKIGVSSQVCPSQRNA